MATKRRPWTTEENERLKAMVASGASIVRAAAALKRKMESVRDQARKLGMPFPTMNETREKLPLAPSNSWR